MIKGNVNLVQYLSWKRLIKHLLNPVVNDKREIMHDVLERRCMQINAHQRPNFLMKAVIGFDCMEQTGVGGLKKQLK